MVLVYACILISKNVMYCADTRFDVYLVNLDPTQATKSAKRARA